MDFDSFLLAASTPDLSVEPAAREYADAIEFRMDLASDGLTALSAYDGALPVLVTNRLKREGGEAPDTAQRLSELRTAIEHPCVTAVDVELSAVRDGDTASVRTDAREQEVSVVVSTHDFTGTPPRSEMCRLLSAASEYGDVAKLAVTAQSRGDVLDLLLVTRELTARGDAVATMAMGELGRHSRAVAPLYGSRIGYAPVDPASATAPGQFDLASLRDLVDRLAGDGPPSASGTGSSAAGAED